MSSGGYAIQAGAGGAGTVTSVGLAMPSIFSVSGSPVIAAGTLTATLVNQVKNTVFAGPATGADAPPTFRVLVAADIPDLSATYATLSGNNVFTSTGYIQIPAGTTAQQPGSPAAGMIRYNSTTGRYEFYTTTWINNVRLSGDTMTGTLTVPTVAITSSLTILDTTQKTALDVATATILRAGNGFTQVSFPSGAAGTPGISFTAAPTYGFVYDSANTRIQFSTAGVARMSVSQVLIAFNAALSVGDGFNIAIGNTTGTKIGTATNQKISLWNVTPIAQPTTAIAAATFVANTSGTVNDSATWDGYTIGQVVKALRNFGLLN